ncbi:2-keto-4-pentenoate hydratase [Aestuariivirga sp.]|uniref:2-keto-4-pentenoate hydratase n=1 Tax=Aestuariivirga sp. TaxID=2650926 RepID=UPI0039E5A65D
MNAAKVLLDYWNAGKRLAELPEPVRPTGRAEGYRVAADMEVLTGDRVAGWKIAATSVAGQKHINVDGPLVGRIYAKRVLPPGAAVSLAGNAMRVAEAEFAFRFGIALPPRDHPYTEEECLAAVSALHLSLEIPDSRYEDFTKVGAAQLIADTACANWLVLGPEVKADWRGIDLAEHRVTGFRNGVQVAEGTGKAVLGGPVIALAWFVNEAARYCGGLKAGQFVTTGTCITPMALEPGDRITADYGGLGSISARTI